MKLIRKWARLHEGIVEAYLLSEKTDTGENYEPGQRGEHRIHPVGPEYVLEFGKHIRQEV